MARTFSRNLQYFPAEVSVWLQKAQLLDSRALGDLLKACLVSWSSALTGGTPGQLPDDDKVLASIIGSEAKARLTLLRQSFRPVEGTGVLRCDWLADLYEEKQASYNSASARGKSGGRPRGTKRKAELFRKKSYACTQSNSSYGGGTYVPPPPSERAVAAPPGPEVAAAAPRGDIRDRAREEAADLWARSQPPEVLAAIESQADERLRKEIPRNTRLAPDGRAYGAIRARIVDELRIEAHERSRASPEHPPPAADRSRLQRLSAAPTGDGGRSPWK